VIQHMIYTQSTKDKVLKPSQWTNDMYILLNWACPTCGKEYVRCACETNNYSHVIKDQRNSGYADLDSTWR
jgi:hypothetical protein